MIKGEEIDRAFDNLKVKMERLSITHVQWLDAKSDYLAAVFDVAKVVSYDKELREHTIWKMYNTGVASAYELTEAFNLSHEDFQALIEREDKKAYEARLIRLATMPYREYLQTPEWQIRRKRILERDGSHCQVCYSTEYLNVHHRTYERRGNEDDSDLITLCRDCHYIFHENGRLAEVDE